MRFKAYFVIIFIFFIFNCKKVENINKSDIRIVSLAPSITKTLFRLGLKENIVGVTDFCEYEGMVNTLVKQGRIKRVSGFYNINYENILSVNPTHILGTDSTTYENKIQLENIFKDKKIYWFIHPKDFSGIKRDILKIGSIFNKEYQAKNLVKEMDDLLNDVQNKIKNKISKPKVLVEIFYPPFMTCGKNTFISDIILKAGGILALQLNEDWPTISLEEIIIADPDIIIKTHSEINNDLKILRCYKQGKIFIPKNIDIFLQPCYESIFAVRELYEYIYEK